MNEEPRRPLIVDFLLALLIFSASFGAFYGVFWWIG